MPKRLSIEAACWVFVVLIAALLRWSHATAPLDEREAAQALRVLVALRAPDEPLSGATSLAQVASFALLGSSEFAARLPALIAGTLLVLIPLTLRPALGRAGALAFGALAAFSPTLTFAARHAEAAIVAWSIALLAFALAARGRTRSAAAALGITLATGPEGAPAALVALVAALFAGARFDQTALPVAGLSFILTATASLSRWVGLGESFNALAATLHTTATLSTARLLAGFVLYEPLAWVSTLASFAWMLAQRRWAPLAPSWLVWLSGGIGLSLLRPTLGSALPLAIGALGLASVSYAAFAERLSEEEPALLATAGLAALALGYAALGLRQLASTQALGWATTPLVSAALLLLILAFGGLSFSYASLLRATALPAVGFLLVYSLAVNTQLNLTRVNNAAEPYRAEAPTEGLSALTRTLQTLSLRATGMPNALRLHYASDAPATLRWALRDWRTASAREAQAWLTPADAQPEATREQIGHGFTLTQRTALHTLTCPSLEQCGALMRWIVFRDAPATQASRWVLWIDSDLALRTSGYR